MKKFKNIISLGAFCFVASELRRYEVRKKAYPFDWIITDLKTVIELIENEFLNFTALKYLEKKEENNIVFYDNNAYSLIRFIHDFNENCDNTVLIQDKYQRRIQRFYQDIKSETLFVRYIINQGEYKYILKKHDKISKLLKSFNSNNDIIYIVNDDIKINYFFNFLKSIKVYSVEKDLNESVAKKFLDKNIKLKKIIIGSFYE